MFHSHVNLVYSSINLNNFFNKLMYYISAVFNDLDFIFVYLPFCNFVMKM